jgi:hypothetical protein
MVIELDTTSKLIRIRGAANLKEVFTFLMTHFEFEWENWSIADDSVGVKLWNGAWKDTGVIPYIQNPQVQNPQIPYRSPVPGIWTGDDPNKYKVTCQGGLQFGEKY